MMLRFTFSRSALYLILCMWSLVNKELDTYVCKLVNEGIIEPVHFAEWAALIVPVLKSDKASIRILK